MSRLSRVGFVLVLFLVAVVAASADPELPKTAVCAVCTASGAHGEAHEEDVKGASEYLGQTYYFCSKNCKKSFDDDPGYYSLPKPPYPAPALTLSDLDGGTVELRSLRGRVVLLDFWATWCKPCAPIMEALSALKSSHGERGLDVLGVSIDSGADAARKVREHLAKHAVSYPILLDRAEDSAWDDYLVRAVPTVFVIDRDGRVVDRLVGKVNPDSLKARVESLLALPVATP